MFSRRRRSASSNRPITPVSPSAQTAATQAFLASRATNANISNAAAAAALRASTSSPTNVAEVQTKRMLQRQASQSSMGSSVAGGGRGQPRGGGLQRQSSSGSMTERTFRSPSPNRPSSRNSLTRDETPPIPPLPPVPPVPQKYGNQHQRSASLEPTPARVISPSPRIQGGRGVSLEREPGKASAPKPRHKAAASLGNINELERSESRNSINFSYPMNARAMSPAPSKSDAEAAATAVTTTSLPKTNGISNTEVSNVQQAVTNAANAPVKKKKKKIATATVEGSHLASGGTGGKPMGTAVPVVHEEPIHEIPTVPAPEPESEPEPVLPPVSTPEPTTQIIETGAVAPAAEALPVRKKKKKVKPSVPKDPTAQNGPVDSDSDLSDTATLEKRAQRAAGILNKQPSVVREDWEGEQEAEEAEQVMPDMSPAASPAHLPQGRKETYAPNTTKQLDQSKASTLPPPTLVTTLPSPEIGTDKPSPKFLEPTGETQSRPPSISPNRSRSARFSAHLASELSAESRHEPPPRSVSPAKSAMKHHSPASITRSPTDRLSGEWRMSSQTPSEASDTNSLASTDGHTPNSKKKGHVSFDSTPEVGIAASTSRNESPPVTKERKGFLGFGKSKSSPLNTIPSDDALEEVFKPRPALPSFGSVRGKRDLTGNRPSTPVTTDVPSLSSSTSSSLSNLATMDTSVSSDHAIGGLIAQDLKTKATAPPKSTPADPNAPLPPVVTSVEGNGYVSDSDSSVSILEDSQANGVTSSSPTTDEFHGSSVPTVKLAESLPKTTPEEVPIEATNVPDTDSPIPATKTITEVVGPAAITEKPVPDVANEPTELAADLAVPKIAIQPATPALEQDGDSWLVSIPGGFPDTDHSDQSEKSEHINSSPSQPIPENADFTSTPAGLGIAEPSPAVHEAGHISAISPVVEQGFSDSESSDGSSIYSDAAEEFPDLEEGDGFGSIMAIVESPVIPSPIQQRSTPPESPLSKRFSQTSSPSWDQAQAHWSELAQQQRQTSGHVGRIDPPPQMDMQIIQEKPVPKPVKKKKASKPANPPVVESNQISIPAAQVTKAVGPTHIQSAPMRKSMRTAPVKADTTPTMRGSGKPMGMKSSMRAPAAPVNSAPALPPVQAKGTLQKRNIPASTTVPNIASIPLQRRLSNDSDSSSSFKRSRRPMSTDGRYTMRRSMRASQDRPQSPVITNGRDVRSLSPSEHRKPFTNGSTMRTSMRGSNDAPTLRNQTKPSGGFSSFGKSSGKKLASNVPVISPTTASRFKSRFANDSDDESPAISRGFQSRFGDSSDEEPEPMRPVRGIPRARDEGDSTDLDDSSDEGTIRRPKVQITSDKALEAHAQSSNQNTIRRRSSGSGRDLSKSTDIMGSPSQRKKGLFGRFRSKKVKDDLKISKTLSESPARKDTHLERTRAELERARSPNSSPAHGKLQRRHPPTRVMSDSWPLPPKFNEPQEGRPSTSDGVAIEPHFDSARPNMLERQDTSSTLRTEGGTPVLGRTGKKKRFPMLRKAFGLAD